VVPTAASTPGSTSCAWRWGTYAPPRTKASTFAVSARRPSSEREALLQDLSGQSQGIAAWRVARPRAVSIRRVFTCRTNTLAAARGDNNGGHHPRPMPGRAHRRAQPTAPSPDDSAAIVGPSPVMIDPEAPRPAPHRAPRVRRNAEPVEIYFFSNCPRHLRGAGSTTRLHVPIRVHPARQRATRAGNNDDSKHPNTMRQHRAARPGMANADQKRRATPAFHQAAASARSSIAVPAPRPGAITAHQRLGETDPAPERLTGGMPEQGSGWRRAWPLDPALSGGCFPPPDSADRARTRHLSFSKKAPLERYDQRRRGCRAAGRSRRAKPGVRRASHFFFFSPGPEAVHKIPTRHRLHKSACRESEFSPQERRVLPAEKEEFYRRDRRGRRESKRRKTNELRPLVFTN